MHATEDNTFTGIKVSSTRVLDCLLDKNVEKALIMAIGCLNYVIYYIHYGS